MALQGNKHITNLKHASCVTVVVFSRQAVVAAAGLGQANNSKITVLVLTPSAGGSPEDSQKRTETINW